jgi:hypothetical protein
VDFNRERPICGDLGEWPRHLRRLEATPRQKALTAKSALQKWGPDQSGTEISRASGWFEVPPSLNGEVSAVSKCQEVREMTPIEGWRSGGERVLVWKSVAIC